MNLSVNILSVPQYDQGNKGSLLQFSESTFRGLENSILVITKSFGKTNSPPPTPASAALQATFPLSLLSRNSFEKPKRRLPSVPNLLHYSSLLFGQFIWGTVTLRLHHGNRLRILLERRVILTGDLNVIVVLQFLVTWASGRIHIWHRSGLLNLSESQNEVIL